ncbi:MAG TPA: TA system VapC family ribonuclease toxin [Planctomycetaceae bacterium]|nr:TA system VapC family ribonuclease toxin [Planctomycetaceae bacterium]
MFLLDTSVWIAQTFDSHPGHAAASGALALATHEQPAVFCRATQQSFLRLASTPTVLQLYGCTGLTNDDALTMLQRLMALSSVAYRDEPEGLVPLWHRFAGRKTASPKVWMDAYIAAFAVAGGLILITLDADFRQFEPAGLKLQLLKVS